MTTYKNAPLNEVVISAATPPILELMPQHIGLLWSALRADFPTCQQHPTIGLPAQGPDDFFPMARFWFVSADDSEVLQLQRDRFTVNWRRRGELEYPRFGAVNKRFEAFYQLLREFAAKELQTEFPPVLEQEVTYINILDPTLGWKGMESLSEALPGFSPPQLGKALDVSAFNIMLAANEISSGNSVGITCRNGTNQATGGPVLMLEIKVSAKKERAPDDVLAWIKDAHDCVINTFNALTSEEMQNDVWLRVDRKNV